MTKNVNLEVTPYVEIEGIVDREFGFLMNKNSLLFLCYLLEKFEIKLPSNCEMLKKKDNL